MYFADVVCFIINLKLDIYLLDSLTEVLVNYRGMIVYLLRSVGLLGNRRTTDSSKVGQETNDLSVLSEEGSKLVPRM